MDVTRKPGPAFTGLIVVILSAALAGCAQHIRDHADRSVYNLVEERQVDSLAGATGMRIQHPDRERGNGTEYDFTPSPLLKEVPRKFPPLDVSHASATADGDGGSSPVRQSESPAGTEDAPPHRQSQVGDDEAARPDSDLIDAADDSEEGPAAEPAPVADSPTTQDGNVDDGPAGDAAVESDGVSDAAEPGADPIDASRNAPPNGSASTGSASSNSGSSSSGPSNSARSGSSRSGSSRSGSARSGVKRSGSTRSRSTRSGTARSDAAKSASGPTRGDDADTIGEEKRIMSKDVFTAAERERLLVFGLSDAIAYALINARQFQNAKEDLYLAGLDLSVERWLWTPRFSVNMRAEYANYGQVRDFDHAMSAVAEAAVTQRLPLGGEITARLIGSFMRDLGESVTSGETGTAILEANIPLLRGAGKVAYESRYAAERELIYAVRSYERFRRSFVVDIANDFFDLQVLKVSIDNTYGSYLSRYRSWEKTDFINRLGRSENISDATRALSNLRSAEVALVARKEQFASALDRFKIRLGMPVDQPLDVLPFTDDATGNQVETLIPAIDERTTIETALTFRLDLITSSDFVDDARRGVVIAKNRILPDLDLSGSVALATDPNQKSMLSYNTERATWRAAINLQMDDRVPERAEYRRSLVTVRRAERSLDQDQDTVRADVRRALRQIARSRDVRDIQALNVRENELRRDAALAQYDLGKASNQDVIDAENELLQAQDSLANAIADYRTAILQFRLDTGTLLVTDEGNWDPMAGFDSPEP